MWKIRRSHEHGRFGGELFGDFTQRFERGFDHLAVAKALLADLARTEQRELEARGCLTAPTTDRAWTGDCPVRLLHLDE